MKTKRMTDKDALNDAYDYFSMCGISPDTDDLIDYISEVYPEKTGLLNKLGGAL